VIPPIDVPEIASLLSERKRIITQLREWAEKERQAYMVDPNERGLNWMMAFDWAADQLARG
jgi:hypothetical protein